MASQIHHFEPQIAQIYDHLYANSSFKTPKAIAREVAKILHTGIYAETRLNPLAPAFSFSPSERKDLLHGEGRAAAGNARYVHDAFAKMNRERKTYPRAEKILLSEFDLAFACAQLDGIWLSAAERDVFGDAVELFRSYWSKSHGGQFFTDSRVTALAIELLDFDPLAGDNMVDICAGTGGFILAAINYLQGYARDRGLDEAQLRDLIEKSLLGQEVDADVADVGNAAISARVGGDLRVVRAANSLVHEPTLNGRNTFRCAATNPPFGTKITIKDPAILRNFSISALGSNGTKHYRPCPPDILFLERNLAILEPGGRLAIVLPYQILSGPQTFRIRQWLLERAAIRAVIDLPAETFQPYTGTKTSLVVLEKGATKRDGFTFMSCPRWIGHDRRGTPVYKRAVDGSETDEILTDLPDVGRAYRAYKDGCDQTAVHQYSFKVPSSQILDARELRFDARFHFRADAPAVPARAGKKSSKQRKTEKLKNLVERIFYPGRFKRLYIDHERAAVPFLGGTNISQLLVLTEKWLSPTNPHLDQLVVKPGWILITRSGSTGIVSSVPEAWNGFAISEHVIRIVPKAEVIPAAYIYAFLKTRAAQDIIKRGVFGSVIDEISPEYLGEIDVPLPTGESELNRIVRLVEGAEASRQSAIEGFEQAVSLLDEAMN